MKNHFLTLLRIAIRYKQNLIHILCLFRTFLNWLDIWRYLLDMQERFPYTPAPMNAISYQNVSSPSTRRKKGVSCYHGRN